MRRCVGGASESLYLGKIAIRAVAAPARLKIPQRRYLSFAPLRAVIPHSATEWGMGGGGGRPDLPAWRTASERQRGFALSNYSVGRPSSALVQIPGIQIEATLQIPHAAPP